MVPQNGSVERQDTPKLRSCDVIAFCYGFLRRLARLKYDSAGFLKKCANMRWYHRFLRVKRGYNEIRFLISIVFLLRSNGSVCLQERCFFVFLTAYLVDVEGGCSNCMFSHLNSHHFSPEQSANFILL